MQKIYFFVQLALCFCTFFSVADSKGQTCPSLTATFISYESRCASTGSIKIFASGGSGSYKYKTVGPSNSNFTTSDSITGLAAGSYTVIINDIVQNCTFSQSGIIVSGTYSDPRFTLSAIDVSCDNGNNGSITVTGQQFGRTPFVYSIVAPSASGVGTTNTTGVFNSLIAGDYSIRLTDSCGGIQTRNLTINNYTWWIDYYSFTKISCDSASGFIRVVDSRGNISTLSGIPGFSYGIVRQPGDTIWSTNPAFTFYLGTAKNFEIVVKDGCGKLKKGSSIVNFTPSVDASPNVYDKSCNRFSMSLTGINNFFGASYCLLDSNNVQISCNSSGVFTNLVYGRYCIRARNACPDTTLIRCITVQPPALSVSNSVLITNNNCNTFTAAISGQTGISNALYCIYDSASLLISCNTSGIFNNLPYGRYCISIEDSCRDTTMTRCFTVRKPRPRLPDDVGIGYVTCSRFGIVVTGDSLYRPRFCLYDTLGVVITCNNTGVFDSLSFGNYCVRVYDSCYDTTIVRCFGVNAPVYVNDLAVTFTKFCSTFTIRATTTIIRNPVYCLFTEDDGPMGCNTTGIFTNILYGAYCVKVQGSCPDTLFTNCFTVSPAIPSVGGSVSIGNKTCTTFSASITGQQNLNTPQYCLYDGNNVQVSCNTTGSFTNIPYGNYCIRIRNYCFDSTIVRCFSASANGFDLSVSSNKSCQYGYATFGVSVSGGNLPVDIKIYRPDNSLLLNRSYNTSSFTIDSIPGIANGLTYMIVGTNTCGFKDTVYVGATASIVSHIAAVFNQCPSAAWQNGSGRIQLTTSSNMGVFTVRVIKKNGVTLSPQLVPDIAAAGVFTFNDLGAGTYIVSYKIDDICNKYLYDTVTIAPYTFPNLSRSSAYQCDVNGFSVGAVVSNGVGPFTYEIINSTPSTPSIVTVPQTSPIFSINNGTNYSLIRLRALDACGNATLNDASILPLADYKIDVDSNCFQSSSTLSVDTIFNSTYSWYKKERYNSTDSTYLGAGYSIYIPSLTALDTGVYVCHITVNTGCVRRTYMYNLNGFCYSYLPITLTEFTGRYVGDQVHLKWDTRHEGELTHFAVERRNTNSTFTEIGKVAANTRIGVNIRYNFIDPAPANDVNYYRLRFVKNRAQAGLSNTVVLNKKKKGTIIKVFPNPVGKVITLTINGLPNRFYKVQLLNAVSQVVFETNINSGTESMFNINRPVHLGKGIYVLKCIDIAREETFVQKLIFE